MRENHCEGGLDSIQGILPLGGRHFNSANAHPIERSPPSQENYSPKMKASQDTQLVQLPGILQ